MNPVIGIQCVFVRWNISSKLCESVVCPVNPSAVVAQYSLLFTYRSVICDFRTVQKAVGTLRILIVSFQFHFPIYLCTLTGAGSNAASRMWQGGRSVSRTINCHLAPASRMLTASKLSHVHRTLSWIFKTKHQIMTYTWQCRISVMLCLVDMSSYPARCSRNLERSL